MRSCVGFQVHTAVVGLLQKLNKIYIDRSKISYDDFQSLFEYVNAWTIEIPSDTDHELSADLDAISGINRLNVSRYAH